MWIFVITFAVASAAALPATAQQKPVPQQAASEQTRQHMHQDVDKEPKTTGQANERMQLDADKGLKTRNSGESGFVGGQDKPGASAHPPGAGK
jgi:Ni/Co efflux regulator RcnB